MSDDITVCEPWLVEQVDRARKRAELPPFTIACPTPGLVEATIDAGFVDPIRLSGFDSGEAWVGAALVALIQTRTASRHAPTATADIIITPDIGPSAAIAPARPAWSLAVHPHVGLVSETPQLGGDLALRIDPITVAVEAGRHAATIRAGTVEAIDLVATAGVVRRLLRTGRFDVNLVAMAGGGVTWLRGESTASTTMAKQGRSGTARATLDVELAEPDTMSQAITFSVGVRVGVRVAPAGQADGREVLVGTGLLLGLYFGIGWRP